MAINEIIAKINKQFGDKALQWAKDVKGLDIDRLPSGSLFLDWALGSTNGEAGFPLGRIVELYGPFSSGKTVISLKTIAEAQKKGFSCAFVDCEKAFDNEFATKLGVDLKKLMISQEAVAERVFDLICELIQEKDIKVIVVDSVASLVPMAELENSLEKATMAEVARVMSKGLRKLNHLNSKALVIFINQLREKPGVTYGNPEYTPGGKALGFYTSIQLDIRRGDVIVDEKTKAKMGQVVKFRVVKNKTSDNFRDGYFKFLYTGELDKIDELISLAILRGVLSQKGAYFYIGDEGFHGREDLEKNLKTKPELYEELKKLVFEEKGGKK